MVAPQALVGKSISSVLAIAERFQELLLNEYNEDNKFRDPTMPKINRVTLGEPKKLFTCPFLSLDIINYSWLDMPQNSGTENTINWNVICWGCERDHDEQFKEALKMSEIIRFIITDKDNFCLKFTKQDELVFSLVRSKTEITVDMQIIGLNFESDMIEQRTSIVEFQSIFYDTNIQ